MFRSQARVSRSYSIAGILLLAAAMPISALYGAESKTSQNFILTSSVFHAGAEIPRKYTCDGEDVSPPLRWQDAPVGTKAFSIIADDPDAPGGTWVHWVIYDLPAETKELREGVAKTEKITGGGNQGINDFRKVGYGGPCPPPGSAHRYFFKLYALDAATNLNTRSTKQQLLDVLKPHLLGEADLVGRYKR